MDLNSLVYKLTTVSHHSAAMNMLSFTVPLENSALKDFCKPIFSALTSQELCTERKDKGMSWYWEGGGSGRQHKGKSNIKRKTKAQPLFGCRHDITVKQKQHPAGASYVYCHTQAHHKLLKSYNGRSRPLCVIVYGKQIQHRVHTRVFIKLCP